MKSKLLTNYYAAKNAFAMRVAGVRDEREEGDHLLEVLGVIIIAVVILIFFREQIIDIFRSAMDKTGDKVDAMFDDVKNTTPATPTSNTTTGD